MENKIKEIEKEQKKQIEQILEELKEKDYNFHFYNCFDKFEEENDKETVVDVVWRMTWQQREDAECNYFIIFDYDNLEIELFESLEQVVDYLNDLI